MLVEREKGLNGRLMSVTFGMRLVSKEYTDISFALLSPTYSVFCERHMMLTVWHKGGK